MSWLEDMLDPAGPQAARIAWLWWVALGIATVVYVLVIGALAYAVSICVHFLVNAGAF